MTDKDLQELQEIASQWTLSKDKRICALCLEEVDRATYNEHTKSHGYETIELTPLPFSLYEAKHDK